MILEVDRRGGCRRGVAVFPYADWARCIAPLAGSGHQDALLTCGAQMSPQPGPQALLQSISAVLTRRIEDNDEHSQGQITHPLFCEDTHTEEPAEDEFNVIFPEMHFQVTLAASSRLSSTSGFHCIHTLHRAIFPSYGCIGQPLPDLPLFTHPSSSSPRDRCLHPSRCQLHPFAGTILSDAVHAEEVAPTASSTALIPSTCDEHGQGVHRKHLAPRTPHAPKFSHMPCLHRPARGAL